MAKGKEKEQKYKGFHAYVSAKWIPVLRQFMSDLNEYEHFYPRTDGLHIASHPEGGITVMGTNGRMMAIVRDKEGSTTRPIRAIIPASIADACEPPKLPMLWSEGEWLDPPEVPAWMSPQWLRLFEIGAWVVPADKNAPGLLACAMIEDSNVHRIGEEYRLNDDPLPWEQCMPADGTTENFPLHVDPLFLGRVCIAAKKTGAESIRITGTGFEKPISVEFVGVPEITVLLMPRRSTK